MPKDVVVLKETFKDKFENAVNDVTTMGYIVVDAGYADRFWWCILKKA